MPSKIHHFKYKVRHFHYKIHRFHYRIHDLNQKHRIPSDQHRHAWYFPRVDPSSKIKKNDEFCIINHELFIRNHGLCIRNHGLFYLKRRTLDFKCRNVLDPVRYVTAPCRRHSHLEIKIILKAEQMKHNDDIKFRHVWPKIILRKSFWESTPSCSVHKIHHFNRTIHHFRSRERNRREEIHHFNRKIHHFCQASPTSRGSAAVSSIITASHSSLTAPATTARGVWGACNQREVYQSPACIYAKQTASPHTCVGFACFAAKLGDTNTAPSRQSARKYRRLNNVGIPSSVVPEYGPDDCQSFFSHRNPSSNRSAWPFFAFKSSFSIENPSFSMEDSSFSKKVHHFQRKIHHCLLQN